MHVSLRAVSRAYTGTLRTLWRREATSTIMQRSNSTMPASTSATVYSGEGAREIHAFPNGGIQDDPTKPSQNYTCIRPEEAKAKSVSVYKILISAVTPRPIFLVSTLNENGVVNVAPFSYSGIVAHSPPTVSFTCTHSSKGAIRDTLRNVRHNKECVVNMISEWFLENANHTSGDFPADVSELEHAKLTPIPSLIVSPPRIAQSAVQMEATVSGFHETKDDNDHVTCTTVFCRVRAFHMSDSVYDSEKKEVDATKFRVVSRLGGNLYGNMQGFWDMPRPKYDADAKEGRYANQ